jgi:enoyl-CoA hydratase/carnithine racemase
VNQVVPAASLIETTRKMLAAMLANGPLALARCIDVVNRGADVALDEGLAMEAAAFGELAATEDMREGTSAFLEKRPPKFRGA